MGDRAQVVIKEASSKVYLYGHWIGADIYPAVARAIGRGRDNDPEYFARIVLNEMQQGQQGETGFGIGTSAHADVEHLIPVMDCEAGRVTWEMPEWVHNQSPAPPSMSFADFKAKALAGEFSKL